MIDGNRKIFERIWKLVLKVKTFLDENKTNNTVNNTIYLSSYYYSKFFIVVSYNIPFKMIYLINVIKFLIDDKNIYFLILL